MFRDLASGLPRPVRFAELDILTSDRRQQRHQLLSGLVQIDTIDRVKHGQHVVDQSGHQLVPCHRVGPRAHRFARRRVIEMFGESVRLVSP